MGSNTAIEMIDCESIIATLNSPGPGGINVMSATCKSKDQPGAGWTRCVSVALDAMC